MDVRKELEAGIRETELAAIATRRGLPLVTRNLRNFNRIPSVEVLTWLDP